MPSPITHEALQPAFRLLGDATGKQMSPETLNNWVEYFAAQNLMAESVNRAASDIAASWEGFGWPTAEYVAKRARARQRGDMNELHGIRGSEQALEDWCEAEQQRRWDARLAEANRWRERGNMEPFKLFVREIDQDIARMIQTGLYPFLTESKPYRGAFREGRAVGRCLVEIGKEARKAARQQEIAREYAVRESMREEAA